jgi:hypothetical protein
MRSSAKADKGIIEVTIPRKPEVLPRKVKVDVGVTVSK